MGMKHMLAIGNRCKYRREYSLEAGLFTSFIFHGRSIFIFFILISLIFSTHCIMFCALENVLPPLFFSFMAVSFPLVICCSHTLVRAFSTFTLAELQVWKIHPLYVYFCSSKLNSRLSCSKSHHHLIFLDTWEECHPSL